MFEELLNRPIAVAGAVLLLSGIVDIAIAQTPAAPAAVRGKLNLFGVASIIVGALLAWLGWA